MTSDPPDSSAFDTGWEGDEDAGLPPALSVGIPGKRPQPPSEPEDRDTLLPPVPPGEYVRTMMELGELDDPSTGLDPSSAATADAPFTMGETPNPPPRASALRAPPPFTPERGLFLDEEEDDVSRPMAAGVSRRDAATAPVRPRSYPSFPAQPRGGSAAVRLPVPRAPSAPPPEAVAGALDVFDGLDPLGDLDVTPLSIGEAHPEPPRPQPPAPALRAVPTGAAGLRLGRPARRATPTGFTAAPEPPHIVEPPVSEPAPNSLLDRVREMRELFASHSYSSALVLAESVLTGDPEHAEARRCADVCRQVLADKYLGRLGGPGVIPRIAVSTEEIRVMALDHRAGFLLSFIDGSMSIEEVLDVSSMPALEALRIMYELREQGAIEIAEPNRRPGRH